jgi:hypothetical protein
MTSWQGQGKTLPFVKRLGKIATNDCEIRHVCPSVRMEQLGSLWTDFHEILHRYFRKICLENLSFIKI